MPISTSYTTIPTTDYDQDSPLTEDLMEDIIDNITFLMEWLGYTYLAGATRDHDHDGNNSAFIAGTTQGTWLGCVTVTAANTNGVLFAGDLFNFLPTYGLVLSWQSSGTPKITHKIQDAGSVADWGGSVGGALISGFYFGGVVCTADTTFLAQKFSVFACKDYGSVCKTGTYNGDGTATQTVTTNFAFDLVIVQHAGATVPYFRSKNHTSTNSRLASGANSTTGIKAVTSTSFDVGAALNTAGQTYHYLLLKTGQANGEKYSIQNYTGDGAASLALEEAGLDISSAFAPQFALIVGVSTNSREPAIAWRGMQPNRSWHGNNTAVSTTGIKSFASNGIVIGASADVNTATEDFDVHYFLGGTRYAA